MEFDNKNIIVVTSDNREHMEDPIACIVSTAEPIASLTSGMSAWKSCTKNLIDTLGSLFATNNQEIQTLAPFTRGSRIVLAFNASIAPDNELK